ncbi:MAG TPA: RHS repeat-associated core domain-containing protein [Anaerolineae bacterium]|nr:RHS repeat-associated core domain-containing protein [Anaerolineae bacterium]
MRRFLGQREETPPGCYDYGARPYDPALGRFLQADTLVPDPANPQSLNRYAYTLNNPLRYTDPSGHYHSDVHYDLTQRWVYHAILEQAYLYGLPSPVAQGLAADLARTVAAADEDVDCKVCANTSYVESGVLHWLTHQEATTLTAAAVDTGSPIEFGRALHGLQDYGAHFGQGYVLEAGAKGETLYARRLAADDLDPGAHGGLESTARFDNARDFGHLRHLDTDDYVPHDSWDRRMREESLTWIHQFAQRYFELNFGVRHPGDELTRRQHIIE